MYTKKIFCLVPVLLSSMIGTTVSAQVIQYFQSPYFLERAAAETKFYRSIEQSTAKNSFIVKHFIGKALEMEGTFNGFTEMEDLVYFLDFHLSVNPENPAPAHTQTGVIKSYIDDGTIEERLLKGGESFYVQVYDSNANPQLLAGTGELHYQDPMWKRPAVKVFRDSILACTFLVPTKHSPDTIYTKTDTPAEPSQQYIRLSRILAQCLSLGDMEKLAPTYPKIVISFEVDQSGKIDNFLPLIVQRDASARLIVAVQPGVGFSERTLKKMKKRAQGIRLPPAVHQGRDVRSKVLLPVNLR